MDDRRFLGLDSSTQSLTALVVDVAGQIAAREAVAFDDELPQYGTSGGQLPSDDAHLGHAPPQMWAAALDLIFTKLARHPGLASSTKAVAVAGQQHGSVYLDNSARTTLSTLSPNTPLHEQLRGIFSRNTAPIWTDSSTTTECTEIREALGGTAAAAALTGSDCFERFTGPQIRKFSKTEPEAYAATSDIALVSSFVTSLLLGDIAPIDHGDGSGMNLMDIRSRQWSARAIRVTADDLAAKLPPLVEPMSTVGRLSGYFSRYGFDDCVVTVGTGDNPSSAFGMGLTDAGDMAISLGTSDTVFKLLSEPRCDTSGGSHVFVAPTGSPMGLSCFRNGSLARERIRDRHGLTWETFAEAIGQAPPGNHERLMIPWFEPEIVPRRPGKPPAHGVITSTNLRPDDAAANCRAVVEGQVMAMKLNSEWSATEPKRIVATGGGSHSRPILQIIADVFGCSVSRASTTDTAALGAALTARQAALGGHDPTVGATASGHHETNQDLDPIEPSPSASATYENLLHAYRALVDRSLGRS